MVRLPYESHRPTPQDRLGLPLRITSGRRKMKDALIIGLVLALPWPATVILAIGCVLMAAAITVLIGRALFCADAAPIHRLKVLVGAIRGPVESKSAARMDR